MQSNLAIVEELMRISAYLGPSDEPFCRNNSCTQHGVPLSAAPTGYKRAGKTRFGTQRYQCLVCKKTLTGESLPTTRQRITHKNREIFALLVNKMPLKRIAAVTGLSIRTVFRKIAFIHQQCLQFAGDRECRLPELALNTRYLSTDRQKFVVNWTSRKSRRNVQLLAIATADVDTGYVFGMNLNFDGALEPEAVAVDLVRFGDDHLAHPFRRYARVWLPQDYDAAARNKAEPAAPAPSAQMDTADALERAIKTAYEEALEREDIENSDAPAEAHQTPSLGMQVHEQCSMSAHIQLVARLLQKAKKLRFFVDQEPGLRAAFMAALGERVKARTADAWYVQILKESTIDEKRQAVLYAKERFDEMRATHKRLGGPEVKLLMMREEMTRAKELGRWNDRWLKHPLPSMSEPDKRVCWLTDVDAPKKDKAEREDQLNHVAHLYLKATLHPIDRFFMQVRRRLSLAERPMSSSANRGRVWNGYSAYQPASLAKALEIFRVYYNYCEKGEDKKTPAMRLGLARGPVALEDILYFTRVDISQAPKLKP